MWGTRRWGVGGVGGGALWGSVWGSDEGGGGQCALVQWGTEDAGFKA